MLGWQEVQLSCTLCVTRLSACESAAVRWPVSLHWARRYDSPVISHATSFHIHRSSGSQESQSVCDEEHVGERRGPERCPEFI